MAKKPEQLLVQAQGLWVAGQEREPVLKLGLR